ncbi:PREDICTED: zinc finger BED domain-containing protein 4-like [Vollenhovia emeryi]|uniref:zinc finger BED domain-containing protein 4-like n=1 Tax=Vollenhovia emeryi TaxID=411798 RepID=UPI0005F416BB|nr:PREDICTED: zinc finger BED domain-containing protein 4-like [Vollenhovia emeryi]
MPLDTVPNALGWDSNSTVSKAAPGQGPPRLRQRRKQSNPRHTPSQNGTTAKKPVLSPVKRDPNRHLQRKHSGHINPGDNSAQKTICCTQTSVDHESEDDPTLTESRPASPSILATVPIKRSRSYTPIHKTNASNPGIICSSEDSSTLIQKQPSIDKTFHKIKAYADGGSKTSKITNALMYMIAVDRQPFSVVEDKGFRNLLSVVAPLYTVPCRKTITKRIDEKYELLSSKIKTMLSKIDTLRLTTDIWTETFNTQSYIGITAHYINFEGMQLECLSLGIKELEKCHNAEYISTIVSEIVDEWYINADSVVAVITDNASNIVKAIRDTFGYRRHMPCFAHTLNLVIPNSITATPEFQTVVKKVKSIVTYFKRSVKAEDALKDLQTSDLKNDGLVLKLKQECETRWNSIFYMIERFVQLANHVNSVLITLPRKKQDDIPEMTTHAELQILKDACAILRPVERVTTEMSSESYVTCSKIIPIVNCLIKTLEKLTTEHDISECLHKNILRELYRRFHSEDLNVEKNIFLATSTLLDPRFKKLHFRSPLAVSTAISKICQLMKENQEGPQSTVSVAESTSNVTEKTEDLWNVHDELIASSSTNCDEPGGIPIEFRQFLNANVISRSKDPLKVWQELKDIYPNVYKVAMKYFVIVGTSVPSERLFSAAGDIISAKRSRIAGKKASQIIFLGSLPEKYWNYNTGT